LALYPGIFRSTISLKYLLSAFEFPLLTAFEIAGEGSSWLKASPVESRMRIQNNFKFPVMGIIFSKLMFLGISDICRAGKTAW